MEDESLPENFDADWYLQRYPDVAEAGEDPIAHYLDRGRREGRFPNAVEERRAFWADHFDDEWYLLRNPDVARSEMNAFDHFIHHGLAERRAPNAAMEPREFWMSCFDSVWYVDRYPDVQRSGLDPFDHFLKYGIPERRRPGRGWTWDAGLALAAAGDAQAVALLRASPLFDPSWYRATYPEVATAGIDPVHHYLIRGARIGYDPGPRFSSAEYLSRNPDMKAADTNPLLHYIQREMR